MATIEMARRVVRRHLKLFEAGAFEGLEAVAQGPVRTDEEGVMIIPAVDFLPGAAGSLYEELHRIEWHEPFDWNPLMDLAATLDETPTDAASLGGLEVCQLIVAHLRVERFCDGHFLGSIRTGQLRALLARVNVLAAGRAGPLAQLHGIHDGGPQRVKRRPRRCTACFAPTIATVLHGMPAYDRQMELDIEEGRLVLGGCLIGHDDPAWSCTTCGAPIKRPLDGDAFWEERLS
ncbi:MAG: DUF6508 domain-containing protein [Planctomycetota bacterium]|nr:DUF6508 domain-containing protein [Planctomycetota bacterium]